MTIVADRLREALKDRGWSQGKLARAIGVTQGAVSQILVGKTSRSKHLPEMARQLGVSYEWLAGHYVDKTGVALPARPAEPVRITLDVILPPESALAEMFDILLAGINPDLPEAERAEQAQLLAERLPIGLSRLQSQRIDQRRAVPRDRPAKGVRSPAATRLPEPQR